MTWCDFLKNLLIALIPALIVVAAAILTLRQFYSQKWWEKRAEVYYNISEDISRLLFCIDEQYEHSIEAKKLSEERWLTLQNEYTTRVESLKMILAGGLFIISEKIFKELGVLIKNLDSTRYREQDESMAEYIGKDYVAVRNFKNSFNNLAKKDLKMK